MLIRTRPFANAIRRRIGLRPRLEDAADRIETIEEQSTERRPGAIFLAAEFEKIMAVQHETTWDAEKRRISESQVTHKPLVRYEFSDALVFHYGCSVKGLSFFQYGPVPVKILLREPMATLNKAHYAMPSVAAPYFGHWLIDAVPSALLTEEDEDLILPTPDHWPHAKAYVRLFELHPHTRSLYRVNKLAVYHDISQSRSKVRRYREMRRRIRKNITTDGAAKKNERIYLRRGTTGTSRTIANEDELIRRLGEHGFTVVDVAASALDEIMSAAIDAEICVTIEGSHQDHALMFLRENGALVAIQPSNRFNCVAIDRTHPIGLHYGFVVADSADDGFLVDCASLLATLDLVEQRRRSSPY